VPPTPPIPPNNAATPVDRGKNNPFNRLISGGASPAASTSLPNQWWQQPVFQIAACPTVRFSEATTQPLCTTFSFLHLPPTCAPTPCRRALCHPPSRRHIILLQVIAKTSGAKKKMRTMTAPRTSSTLRVTHAISLRGSCLARSSHRPTFHHGPSPLLQERARRRRLRLPAALSAPTPPPPPPAPPAPTAPAASAAPAPTGDRGALLSAIQNGTRLRKAVTNDRSVSAFSGRVLGDVGPPLTSVPPQPSHLLKRRSRKMVSIEAGSPWIGIWDSPRIKARTRARNRTALHG
jgi:hypothetical protein